MEMRIIAMSMVVLVMMGSLILKVVGGGSGNIRGMFVFGDSLGDAGTNNFIPNCTARADFPPYGFSSFLRPTGRFTNGLTIFDFIARRLELPLIPPYRVLPSKVSNLPWRIYKNGANFASGGSGLLDSTGAGRNTVTLEEQISKFEEFSKTVPSNSCLKNSLYCISSGSNDINDYFNNPPPSTNTTELVTQLIDAHCAQIKVFQKQKQRAVDQDFWEPM